MIEPVQPGTYRIFHGAYIVDFDEQDDQAPLRMWATSPRTVVQQPPEEWTPLLLERVRATQRTAPRRDHTGRWHQPPGGEWPEKK